MRKIKKRVRKVHVKQELVPMMAEKAFAPELKKVTKSRKVTFNDDVVVINNSFSSAALMNDLPIAKQIKSVQVAGASRTAISCGGCMSYLANNKGLILTCVVVGVSALCLSLIKMMDRNHAQENIGLAFRIV